MISTLPAWGLGGSVAEGALQVRTAKDRAIAAKNTFMWFNSSAPTIVLEDTRWSNISPLEGSMAFRCLPAVMLLSVGSVGWGQPTTSTLTGVVKDATGAVIPAARIQVVNEGSGV